MRQTLLIPAMGLTTLMAMSLAGFAQQDDAARFSMEKTANGYVRMDKQTGDMSICTENAGQLVCKLAADDRDAFENEMDRLQGAVDQLERRVSTLESGAGTGSGKAMPTEEEFDQTMSYMQKFLRSFMGMVKEFDQDLRGPTPEGEQRT